MEIGRAVPEKKFFEDFLPYMDYDGQETPMLHTTFSGSHLGHVTSIMSINFHFFVPESLHIKFGFDWLSGF